MNETESEAGLSMDYWMHRLADWPRRRACRRGQHGNAWEYTPRDSADLPLVHYRQCRHCGQMQKLENEQAVRAFSDELPRWRDV